MDVTLSIVTGLGLRLFLGLTTGSSPSNPLTTAALGLWEGIILHQLSGRSLSPNLDHLLAYGLRLAVDLFVSKNLQRMGMVVLWSTLGTITSEVLTPHASLREGLERDRERKKERRRKHSRPIPVDVPILSIPLPPRIRAYKPPNPDHVESSITPSLTVEPPPETSTPRFPTDRPSTPPSFFLQENSVSSPSPKPIQLQLRESSIQDQDALPVRPRSGLASIFDQSPESGSPTPARNHLPTPPESAQSAVPSDETYPDGLLPRFGNQLYTIPEGSSPEDNATPTDPTDQQPYNGNPYETRHQAPSVQNTETTSAPLPVPNPGIRHSAGHTLDDWLTSQSTNVNPESIFPNQFATTLEIPPPLPVRMRLQEPLWQIETPTDLHPARMEERMSVNGNGNGYAEFNHDHQEESDSDELRTPGARHMLDMETDNEHDPDPLLTPIHRRPLTLAVEEVLSPLSLNVRSNLDRDEWVNRPDAGPSTGTSAAFSNATEPQPHVPDPVDIDDLQIPGSLSQNPLLQPPLPPSGPLFRNASPPPGSPPPPSPSTINSNGSDVSVLSTRVPNKLFRRADELRQIAREQETRRTQMEERRRLAEAEGRTMEALALKIKVREMDAEALKLHEKAARRYFVARNPHSKSSEIDVHGLRPREAFDRIERAIVKASEEKRPSVRIIVGKGLHSVNQKPALKPAVQREMHRLKIQCEVDARNPGVLIVMMPSSRPPA